MPKYGIATLLDSKPVGYEFKASDTPLHITHVDSFTTDLDTDTLALKLSKRLKNMSAFTVKAVEDEMLGVNKDIPVTKLELNDQLSELHRLIMQLLEDEHATLKNPQFHNEGFNPHISIYGLRRVEPGTQIHLKDICVSSRINEDQDPTHRILAVIPLKQLGMGSY